MAVVGACVACICICICIRTTTGHACWAMWFNKSIVFGLTGTIHIFCSIVSQRCQQLDQLRLCRHLRLHTEECIADRMEE